jgi:hypothetical protein
MFAMHARLMRSALKLGAVLLLVGLGLVAMRLASELGIRAGRSAFAALGTYRPMAPDARETFEAVAAVAALVASVVAIAWSGYRLVVFRRRRKDWLASQRRSAPGRPA